MKEQLKKLIYSLGLEYQGLKFKEFYMKTRFPDNGSKEKYIKKKFKEKLGYEINFSKEPVTFNEKIQFRKLYDNNPLYSICADKYRVREYVKEKIGEEYLIPLLLVTDKLTEEQWNKLPNQFVAKANHNSGPVQIVKDKSKADKKEIIKELNNQLKLDYGILSMEKYYSDIPRKIIVEEFLEDNIKDYKFHIFRKNNDLKIFLQVDGDRFIKHRRSMFDKDFNFLEFKFVSKYDYFQKEIKNELSRNTITEIYRLLDKLSEDFDYVRVDLYNLKGKLYFGELTFCAESGLGDFEPIEWDYKFGSYWKQKN